MRTSFELRTMRDRPVLRFDDEARARSELVRRSKRIGIPLRLVRITTHEEEIAA